jgi:amidase
VSVDDGFLVTIAPASVPPEDPAGPLSGLTYAVKDLLDVAGVPTTAGNPDFSRWRGMPSEDAWTVKTLNAAGARLAGKTHLHELAFGLTGVNPHYGTPVNPVAPDRIPGGSSSGSAVAVAGNFVDFALGTDTGGSVRLPASFCGIYGYRPSHGLIPAEGVVPLAPSFDTVGVFARSAGLLEQVARVLLGGEPTVPLGRKFRGILLAADSLQLVSGEAEAALRRTAKLVGELLELPIQHLELGVLAEAREAQKVLQGAEAWSVHEDWIRAEEPELGPDVRRLLEAGAELPVGKTGRASAARASIFRKLERLLADDTLLLMPAAMGPAPTLASLAEPAAALEFRSGTLAVMNLASITGLPVVVVPGSRPEELPIGVQLIGPRGSDGRLLELASSFHRRI